MPAFKRLGPDDQLDNVLIVQPTYLFHSGAEGWSGSPNESGSVSLYGGARRRPGIFSKIEYESHAPNVGQTGNPTRGEPMTASIQFVYMTSDRRSISERGPTRWGEEHWDVVSRLYQDYRVVNADYVTSSYDYYCLNFHQSARNVVIVDLQDELSNFFIPTASFTIESWIKPLGIPSLPNPTIQSMNRSFRFGLKGLTNQLFLSSSIGLVPSSTLAVDFGKWSHVAFSFDSLTRTGSFFINCQFAGAFGFPSASLTIGNPDVYYSVGNTVRDDSVGFAQATGSLAGISFNGMIGETRYWRTARTASELNSSAYRRLSGSELLGPTSCLMFNEGPLARVQSLSMGSGVLDYAARAQNRRGDYSIGKLDGFNSFGLTFPVWQPNDNVSFFPTKQFVADSLSHSVGTSDFRWGPNTSGPVERMLVVNVPSALYGRQIVPGSVRLIDRSVENAFIRRVLIDDGRGGLYISGSVSSGSDLIGDESAGVTWNKVGNVFYGEGLITIKDPGMMDFGRDDSLFNEPNSTLVVGFKGDTRIPVKTLMCRIDHGEFNCSTNPTFFSTGSAGERLRRHPSGSIRASTVGIYNSSRELVAVARLADPVRIRARDRINIRIRMDF